MGGHWLVSRLQVPANTSTVGSPGKPSLHVLELLCVAEPNQPQSPAEVEGERTLQSHVVTMCRKVGELLLLSHSQFFVLSRPLSERVGLRCHHAVAAKTFKSVDILSLTARLCSWRNRG